VSLITRADPKYAGRMSVEAFSSQMTPQDWIALGLMALMPVLMAVAIYLIRREIKQAPRRAPVEPLRSHAPPLQLKTTEAQRAQWRMGRQRHPRAIVDLTDDIETLLKRVKASG
jgi:hypothetical protein